MNPSRRALLLSALAVPPKLLGLGDAPPSSPPPTLRLTDAPGGRVLVSMPGDDAHGLLLPAARARLVARARLQNCPVALVRFGADPSPGITCDLLAVIGLAPDGPRLAALEVLDWRRADGAHLATIARLSADGTMLLLARAAARPRNGGLVWAREAWTDMLSGQPVAPLRDAPPHRPVAFSWQARLAARRAEVRALLGAEGAALQASLLRLATDAAP